MRKMAGQISLLHRGGKTSASAGDRSRVVSNGCGVAELHKPFDPSCAYSLRGFETSSKGLASVNLDRQRTLPAQIQPYTLFSQRQPCSHLAIIVRTISFHHLSSEVANSMPASARAHPDVSFLSAQINSALVLLMRALHSFLDA